MIIRRNKEYNFIEVFPQDDMYLMDSEKNIYEGICMKDKGQTDEEIRNEYTEITEEEKKAIEEEMLNKEDELFKEGDF